MRTEGKSVEEEERCDKKRLLVACGEGGYCCDAQIEVAETEELGTDDADNESDGHGKGDGCDPEKSKHEHKEDELTPSEKILLSLFCFIWSYFSQDIAEDQAEKRDEDDEEAYFHDTTLRRRSQKLFSFIIVIL